MANENINSEENKPEEHKHTSFLKHMVEEIKEEFDELVEEAQNDGGEFSVLGNGHINHVHDHRHDHDADEKKEEDKKAE